MYREVISKLRTENVKLRKELKTISEDLTVMVDKKRTEKVEVFHPPHARDYIAGTATSGITINCMEIYNILFVEKGLQSELETATKQLTRLKKETDHLSTKCDAHGTYEKFVSRQEHMYQIENKIQEILNQKKVVDKTLREKERLLDTLLNPSSGQNYQVNEGMEYRILIFYRLMQWMKTLDY